MQIQVTDGFHFASSLLRWASKPCFCSPSTLTLFSSFNLQSTFFWLFLHYMEIEFMSSKYEKIMLGRKTYISSIYERSLIQLPSDSEEPEKTPVSVALGCYNNTTG